jgi:hypothetical protein
MTETSDAGIAASKITPTASLGSHDEFNVISTRIIEADEGFHLPLFGFLRGARLNLVSKLLKRRGGFLETWLVFDLEANTLAAWVALRVA